MIELISDSSILVRFADQPSLDANDRALRFFYRVRRVMDGLKGVHPAYASVSIDFDPAKIEFIPLRRQLEKILEESKREHAVNGEIISIPTLYDGPDLDEVAKLLDLTTEEVVRLHSGVEYKVAFLGFTPGFPYLHGLPQRLNCPRKSTPRVRVPAGSVAIAGKQAGIYPSESPGGWQLIGRTDADLFDPRRTSPALFKPGDRVHFVPTRALKVRAEKKLPRPQAPAAEAMIEVLDGGVQSSLQDLGRPNYLHLGISAGGAADPLAYKVGLGILGNPAGAPAIEMTMKGGRFRFLKDTWIALTGSECDATLDGRTLDMWSAIPVKCGQELVCGVIENMRTYLHVRGGFQAEVLLGSKSTFVSGHWGGALLNTGDFVKAGEQKESHLLHRPPALILRRMYSDAAKVLRVTRGPQFERFDPQARSAFFETTYTVADEVNRLGLRLEGTPLPSSTAIEELTTEGVAPGTVQIPSSGKPLLLFCEQCTTGGYPRIANVIGADLWRLGQLKPGAKFRFHEVSLDEAWRLRREQEDALQRVGFGF